MHHAYPVAALLARAQSCRMGLGIHEGEVPVAAITQRLRRHRPRRMQRLEPPPRRDRTHYLALLPPLDHGGETLSALVLLFSIDATPFEFEVSRLQASL